MLVQKTVVGIFSNRSKAEEGIRALEKQGFNDREVSLVAKGDEAGHGEQGHMGHGQGQMGGKGQGKENLSDGAGWGGGIGATAGLLAGIGALAIPGFGPIIAAGPIAAALTGAATGGLAGGLLDYGIPDATGRQIESDVKRGEAVALVRSESEKVEKAVEILRKNGAKEVEIH